MAVLSEAKHRSGEHSGDEKALELNEGRDLLVAQGMSPYAELTRQGDGWSFISVAAVAALVVRPSTTAAIVIWNGNTAGGKSYVVDRMFAHNLVSTAAESFFGQWACLHPAGMTNPGEDIAASATNLTGNTGKRYNGNAVIGINETVIDNGWYPWGNGKAVSASGVIPGSHDDVHVDGRLIIPPQGGLSLHVVGSLVGLTFTQGLSFYEVQLALN